MLNPFNNQTMKSTVIPAAAGYRDAVLRFILRSLQPYVDEKAAVIDGLRLYVRCKDVQEATLAQVALFLDQPGHFKDAILERHLLNHYINLSRSWFFEVTVMEGEFAAELLVQDDFALDIIRPKSQLGSGFSKAVLKTLLGQTEQSEYALDPAKQLKYYIGRSRQPRLASGKIHPNDIVFLGADEPGYDAEKGKGNLQVSRNHAMICFDTRFKKYFLYPDKGGLPESGNKLKVYTEEEKVKQLNIEGVPHELKDGDQIALGGEAILVFLDSTDSKLT